MSDRDSLRDLRIRPESDEIDYDSKYDGRYSSRSGRRYLPVAIFLGVTVSFMSLAWYAYHAGTEAVHENDLLLVEADKEPVKEQPLDPGGMKFPHQDKTVYETITNSPQKTPAVERVLPAPESPAEMSEEPTIAQKQETPAPEKPREVVNAAKAAPVGDVSVAEVSPSAGGNAKPAEAPVESVTLSKPETVETQKAERKQDKPVQVASLSKPEKAAPVSAASASGSGVAQLGAFKSEAEANGEWDKMQKKFSMLSGKKPTIAKAEVKDKGTFYRLRVAGVDSKALCAQLSAKGQACMPVK